MHYIYIYIYIYTLHIYTKKDKEKNLVIICITKSTRRNSLGTLGKERIFFLLLPMIKITKYISNVIGYIESS